MKIIVAATATTTDTATTTIVTTTSLGLTVRWLYSILPNSTHLFSIFEACACLLIVHFTFYFLPSSKIRFATAPEKIQMSIFGSTSDTFGWFLRISLYFIMICPNEFRSVET